MPPLLQEQLLDYKKGDEVICIINTKSTWTGIALSFMDYHGELFVLVENKGKDMTFMCKATNAHKAP